MSKAVEVNTLLKLIRLPKAGSKVWLRKQLNLLTRKKRLALIARLQGLKVRAQESVAAPTPLTRQPEEHYLSPNSPEADARFL